MLTQKDGERKIRTLQKEFLCWVEEHPVLSLLPASEFHNLRTQLFRATFDVFRLGVVGVQADTDAVDLYMRFLGWIDEVVFLPGETAREVRGKCFKVALEAFRIGAMVSR